VLKKGVFTILAAICSLISFAQGTVSGTVSLTQSEQPLSEVFVYIDGGKYNDITSLNGQYVIPKVPAGEHSVTISSIGFKTQVQTIVVTDKDINLDIQLVEEIIDIPGVVISSVASTGGMLGSLDLAPSTNYISPKELAQINTTDVNKVLFNIPGVNLQEEDGFGLRPNIGLRGSGSERSSKITVMEDEVLSAPAPYAAPSAYYFPTVGRMSGLEVRKGSSQIEYGPYTTGGVINLISTPIPTDFKGSLRVNAGEFATRNVHANAGGKIGQFSYLVETFQYQSDGFKNLPNNADTGFDKKDYLGKLKWETKTEATVYQSFQFKIGDARENSDETYLGLSFDDFQANAFNRYAGSQADNMDTDQQQYSFSHIIQPASNVVIKTTAYNNNFARNWYKLDKVRNLSGDKVGISSLLDNPLSDEEAFSLVRGIENSGTSQVLDVKANNREYFSRGVQTKLNWSKEATAAKHDVEIGFRYHRDQMDRFQWVDGYAINNGIMELVNPGTQGTESNRLETASAFAGYVHYDLKLSNLTISPGLRYENINVEREDFGKTDPERSGNDLTIRSNDENVVIPGLSFQYKLTDEQQLFAGVHKGFAPPGSKPETNAEESTNYELGYRILKQNTFASAVVFYNDYSNLLGADNGSGGGSGSGDLFNGGEAKTLGLELAGQTNFVVRENLYLPLNISYTYTNAEFQSSFGSDFDGWGDVIEGDELPYLAPHQLSASFGMQSKKVGGILRASYVDDIRTIPGQGALTASNSISNRFLLNADVNVSVNKNISVLANLNNILDQTYAVAQRPSGFRPGMPRAFSIGADVRF